MLVAAFFCGLNFLTPLLVDDFRYIRGIKSLNDIFVSVHEMYFSWTGRSVAHFLTEFWLLLGKPLFNIANTVVYCVFVLLIQYHITGSSQGPLRKQNPLIFVCINVFLWYFVPTWGQNFLWLTGSCNYLWTTTIILFFLVPYRKKIDDARYRLKGILSLPYFFLGILAGWTNENSGAAVLLLLIACFIINKSRKNKIAMFEITGAAGFIIGFFFLIAAPGNYARAISEQAYLVSLGASNSGIVIILLKRFINITLKIFENYSFIIIILSVLVFIDAVRRKKAKTNIVTRLYALAGMAGIYSMLLSPSFSDRTFLIMIVFWCITLGSLLVQHKQKIPELLVRNAGPVLISLVIIFSSSVFFGAKNIGGVYLKWQDRIRYIEAEKEKGNFDIEVKAPIPATNRHTACFRLDDITNDTNFWRNADIAAYFGLNSIKKLDDDTPW